MTKAQRKAYDALSPAQKMGFELGKMYLSAYWHDTHTIIAEGQSEIGIPWVTSRWSDGRESTHSTYRDMKRDREIVA